MRKSLLMTSALGLMMPTLAMANAAAGSSAAACGSGFFAQIDAKIMNAKLEIKNEKSNKSEVPANEETDVDKIIAMAAADTIAQVKKAEIEPLFNYGTEVTKSQFVTDLLALVQVENLRGRSAADVATEIGRVAQQRGGLAAPVNGGAVLPVGTDAEKKAVLRVGGRELIDNALNDADGAKIFDNVVSDVMKLVKTINPTVKAGSLNAALANTILTQVRNNGMNAAAAAAEIVDPANLRRSFYSKKLGSKLYLINA